MHSKGVPAHSPFSLIRWYSLTYFQSVSSSSLGGLPIGQKLKTLQENLLR